MSSAQGHQLFDWDQVPRLVLRPLKTRPYSCFTLWRFPQAPGQSCQALLEMVDKGEALFGLGPSEEEDAEYPAVALQIALTWSGLATLGLPRDVLTTFSHPFQRGPNPASQALGDVGPSAPKKWIWGCPDRTVHFAVLLYARSDASLERRLKSLTSTLRAHNCGGATLLAELHGHLDDKEPFGFRDGISQPRIALPGREATKTDPWGAKGPTLATGEFLLGYPTEQPYDAPSPHFDPELSAPWPELRFAPSLMTAGHFDLGRNGTYLVVRDLAQDVAAFDRYCEQQARALSSKAQPPVTSEWIKARMVGRWPDGSPVTRFPDAPADNQQGFDYRNDEDGLHCPLGAHIRRANPRNKEAKRHQILRRGRVLRRRKLGPEYEPLEQSTFEDERGLLFLAINSEIDRQFEFIQENWINGASFNGVRKEVDPLVGSQSLPTTRGSFTIPSEQGLARRCHNVDQFVIVRGSAYFFLPGLNALRFLLLYGIAA